MRKLLLAATSTVCLCYLILQVYIGVNPPFMNTGYGHVTAHSGEEVFLGVHFRKTGIIPFELQAVSLDPQVLDRTQSCVIEHDVLQFTGSVGPDLPESFKRKCVAIEGFSFNSHLEYAIATKGKVLSGPDKMRYIVKYRVLGWPHRLVVDLEKPITIP